MYLKFRHAWQFYHVDCLASLPPEEHDLRKKLKPLDKIQGVHCTRLLDVQNILSADTGISRQTVGHSFGDHLMTLSSVIEASIMLCSVSLWLMCVNVQSACALNTRYLSYAYVTTWRHNLRHLNTQHTFQTTNGHFWEWETQNHEGSQSS
jgi:hypothetical protein